MAEIFCPQCGIPNRDSARYCADCGAPLMSSVPVAAGQGGSGRPSTPTPGMILEERYRIEGELGRGGFGAVFKAWDLRLNKWVAVKENLDASEEAQRQFAREAMTLANLSHPNLPRVIDHFIVTDRGQYLVMDFVDGQDLNSMIERQGAVPPAQAAAWIAQVAEALEYLHSQEPPVLHRDIKPANIRVSPRGRAILVDFGLVKFSDPALKTTLGARAVTPGYAPPEQYGLGKTDERTDLYALGATLYRALTGKEPLESVQRMAAQSQPSAGQTNPAVPQALSQVVERAMRLNPDERFQSAVEFRAALQAAMAEIHPGTVLKESEGAPAVSEPFNVTPGRISDRPSTPQGTSGAQTGVAAYTASGTQARPVSHPAQGRPSRPIFTPTGETGTARRRKGIAPRLAGALVVVLCLGVVFVGYRIWASQNVAAIAVATAQGQQTVMAHIQGTRAAQEERLAQQTRLSEAREATRTHAVAGHTPAGSGVGLIGREAVTAGPSNGAPATRAAPDAYLPPEARGQATLVVGPLNGELVHDVTNGRTEIFSPSGVFTNYVVETRFTNPYARTRGAWDYGYLFRYVGANDHFRLIINSNGDWSLRNKTNSSAPGIIQRGKLSNLKTEAGESNTVTLVCIDRQGWFILNGTLIAKLDLSAHLSSGRIQIGAGFFDGAEITGQTTRYDEFTVWTLPAKKK